MLIFYKKWYPTFGQSHEKANLHRTHSYHQNHQGWEQLQLRTIMHGSFLSLHCSVFSKATWKFSPPAYLEVTSTQCKGPAITVNHSAFRSEPPSYSPNPGFAQYMYFHMIFHTNFFVTREHMQPLSSAPLARAEDHSSVQQIHRRQSFVCTYIL